MKIKGQFVVVSFFFSLTVEIQNKDNLSLTAHISHICQLSVSNANAFVTRFGY